MTLTKTTERTRSLIGLLVALPLTAAVLVAVYSAVGVIG